MTHFKFAVPGGKAPGDTETPHALALRLGLIHAPEKYDASASLVQDQWRAV